MTNEPAAPADARRRLIVAGALLAIYVAAGKFGLSLAFVNASASAVWPPSGIAVAALLLLGIRFWPVIALGALLVNITTSGSVPASIAIAAGNTLEAVVAAALTNRFAGGRAVFDHPLYIVRFTLGAALGATMIAATIGVFALDLAGLATPADILPIWITWWLGDAVGVLVITPLVLLWRRSGEVLVRPIETAALLLCLLAVSYVVFGNSASGSRHLPLAFLLVPAMLWPAFRAGAWQTAFAAAVMAVLALSGTIHEFGPFVRSSPNVSLLMVQAFIGVINTVMLSVAAEVAARRRIEAEMRALNETLERRVTARTEEMTKIHDRLVDAQQVAHVGSWEWDVVANSLWWSEELFRIYGLEPGEAASYEAYLTRVHPDDRDLVQRVVGKALADGQPFAFEHRLVKPDGEVRTMYGKGRVEQDKDGKPLRMVGIGHDVTERRAAEEERIQLTHEQAARREAEDANRTKDEFLAILSHELRTPLNAALGWAHILRESQHQPARNTRAFEALYRNLLVQARLVSDILDVSRITTGRWPLDRGLTNVQLLVESAVDTVRDAATRRGVRIETQVSGHPTTIVGDERRLQQVLWNLLSNAIKFAAERGLVTISVQSDDTWVEILVEDDGPGITPDFLPHVFEQFRQADSSITREHGGLGLGLAIAHHIVELHGGTIAASNRDTGGARFCVRLPCRAASAVAPARGTGGGVGFTV